MTGRIRRSIGAGGSAGLWLALMLLLILPIGLFLAVAVAPRLAGQGSEFFTLAPFREAVRPDTLRGFQNSLVVGALTAVLATAVALALAWVLQRTTVPGRAAWSLLIWVLLLAPSFLMSLGWERLLEADGMLAQVGIQAGLVRTVFFGPVGVVLILTSKAVPFAFLAISPALSALGRQYEEAARIHGGGRLSAAGVVLPILAPAILSALAIVFAESISDFGVASTIANTVHFPIATLTLFTAVDSFPANFPVAAAVGWLLVGAVSLALVAQAFALRSPSYRVLSGRTRPAPRVRLGPRGKAAALLGLGAFFAISLGVPAAGAISASLVKGSARRITPQSLTATNYTDLFARPGQLQPIVLSGILAAIGATFAVCLGVVVARELTRSHKGVAPRLLDLLLLATVALPGIVLGAGYIFAYNLPVLSALGIGLYGTVVLLQVAYIANSLPSTARILVGPVAQIESSVYRAARVHGAGAASAWLTVMLPLLSRSLLWAWLFSFTGVLFELPISQLLTPPGQEPLSVAIDHLFANYTYGPATALMVTSVGAALLVVCGLTGAFRLLAPRGWLHVGTSR